MKNIYIKGCPCRNCSRYTAGYYDKVTSVLIDYDAVKEMEDYEIVGPIGSGSYGTCKKIRRKSDGKVWRPLFLIHDPVVVFTLIDGRN